MNLPCISRIRISLLFLVLVPVCFTSQPSYSQIQAPTAGHNTHSSDLSEPKGGQFVATSAPFFWKVQKPIAPSRKLKTSIKNISFNDTDTFLLTDRVLRSELISAGCVGLNDMLFDLDSEGSSIADQLSDLSDNPASHDKKQLQLKINRYLQPLITCIENTVDFLDIDKLSENKNLTSFLQKERGMLKRGITSYFHGDAIVSRTLQGDHYFLENPAIPLAVVKGKIFTLAKFSQSDNSLALYFGHENIYHDPEFSDEKLEERKIFWSRFFATFFAISYPVQYLNSAMPGYSAPSYSGQKKPSDRRGITAGTSSLAPKINSTFAISQSGSGFPPHDFGPGQSAYPDKNNTHAPLNTAPDFVRVTLPDSSSLVETSKPSVPSQHPVGAKFIKNSLVPYNYDFSSDDCPVGSHIVLTEAVGKTYSTEFRGLQSLPSPAVSGALVTYGPVVVKSSVSSTGSALNLPEIGIVSKDHIDWKKVIVNPELTACQDGNCALVIRRSPGDNYRSLVATENESSFTRIPAWLIQPDTVNMDKKAVDQSPVEHEEFDLAYSGKQTETMQKNNDKQQVFIVQQKKIPTTGPENTEIGYTHDFTLPEVHQNGFSDLRLDESILENQVDSNKIAALFLGLLFTINPLK